MELIRVCPGCKWEFPHTFHNVKCTFCGTTFDLQWCNKCQEFKPNDAFYHYKNGTKHSRCRACERIRQRQYDIDNPERRKARSTRWYDKVLTETEQRYENWKKVTAALPFKILSEDQWLAACEYFRGCAICGEDHIETRQYFIQFQEGGKYVVWNIFPMCGKCSTYMRKTPNPFKNMSEFFAGDGMYIKEDKAKRLVDYLQLQIEKVQNEQKTNGV